MERENGIILTKLNTDIVGREETHRIDDYILPMTLAVQTRTMEMKSDMLKACETCVACDCLSCDCVFPCD